MSDTAPIPERARVQDDLFGHAHGAWLDTVVIPEDRSVFGSFDMLRDRSEEQVRAIIESCDPDAGGSEGAIGALYQSFMDADRVEALGVEPLRPLLADIDSVSDRAQLPALLGRLAAQGVSIPAGFGVGQDRGDPSRYVLHGFQAGLGLPDASYYGDAEHVEILSAYRTHVATMFDLAGLGGADEAARVLALESQLARFHWSRVACRDALATYNLLEASELVELLPPAGEILAAAGVPPRGWEQVCVMQPSAFEGVASLLDSLALADWLLYLRWKALCSLAPYLSSALDAERFAFYGGILSGTPQQRPRWKRGVALVEAVLGEALGSRYVEAHYPDEAAAEMEQLVANLLAAYQERISELDWMEPATRVEALAKLSSFTAKIGKPVRFRSYEGLGLVRDDLVGNVLASARFEHEYDLGRLSRAVDRDEWHMTPQTVNAYYHPVMNEIVFPASILQLPFFDAARDAAFNYGAIGAVIGHEIGHGFDDQGSRYDGSGQLRQWWSEADRERFGEKIKALIAQYDQFSPRALDDSQRVSGALTVGENIGDLGGVAVAFHAYQLSLGGAPAPVVDGLTGQQRFFLGWADAWQCAARPEEAVRRLKLDPHAPPEFRANIVRNVDAFHEAFATQPGDGLWLDPAERIRIW